MRLSFLGSGGGRWVVLRQLRASGGFVLELANQKMHIDPGPGALVRAREHGVNLCDLTVVLVSHRHLDHMNDALAAIECMTKGATKKGGLFASTPNVINDDPDYPSILDRFHKGVLGRIEVVEPGYAFSAGKVKVLATRTVHKDNDDGVGFVFSGDGQRIGYTGDGEYYSGMEDHFSSCDYLIMNVLRPRTDSWPGHMNTDGAFELISKAKPKHVILQHFGMKMLRGVAIREAQWLSKETGIKVTAARDGLVITHGSKGLPKKSTLEGFVED